MRLTRRLVVVGVAVFTVTLGVATTTVAASARSAGHSPVRHGTVFRSTLIGRPAAASLDVAIRGVVPGAVPWALTQGATRVSSAGRLSLHVEGLVITGTGTHLDGTTGPVTKVVASLTCDGATPAIVSTGAVPLSAGGDARIDQRVAVPSPCLAPIVLVRANSSSGPWIAATGT
jgi:hypothetical protein